MLIIDKLIYLVFLLNCILIDIPRKEFNPYF